MATETQVANDTPVSDYQTTTRARGPRISAEVKIAPTCMFWAMVVGLGLMVCTVLLWASTAIGTLDFGLLFR